MRFIKSPDSVIFYGTIHVSSVKDHHSVGGEQRVDKKLSECTVEEIWDHLNAYGRKKLFHFYLEHYPETAQEAIDQEWTLGIINLDIGRGKRFF